MILKHDIEELFTRQLENWPLARDNFYTVLRTKARSVRTAAGVFHLRLVYNPCRVGSTTANISKENIEARKCFLCKDNQPEQQESIIKKVGKNEYRFQVNPYPITVHHFTIADTAHRPQLITGRIADMWQLAQELDEFMIAYNGPRCGASAPDHFHLHAAPAGFTPLYDALFGENSKIDVLKKDAGSITGINRDLWCPHFIVYAKTARAAMTQCEKIIALLPRDEQDEEPKVNIACCKEDRLTAIAIFPRSKHRPDSFGTGRGKYLISPGVFDMAGLITVVNEDDYRKLNRAKVTELLYEVSLDSYTFYNVAIKIKHSKEF